MSQDKISEDFLPREKINESIDSLPLYNVDPPRIRYFVLFLAFLLNLGSFFIYDNPAVLQTQLQNKLGIDSLKYNLFYSVYSFPNIILPIFGGFLVDRIGNKNCNIIFTLLILIGQALFAFSISIDNYSMALAGRCLFGIGGESLNISQYNVIIGWANIKEASLSLALAASFGRLSTAANDFITPYLNDEVDIIFALWFGAMLCGISFGASLILAWFDKNKQRYLGNYYVVEEHFNMKDIKDFGISLWLLALNCCFVFAAVYCFDMIGSNYFQERFDYSTEQSGQILSIIFIVCAILCPFLGMILDRYGYRIHFIFFSGFFATLTHVLFLFTPDSTRPLAPILYMFILGLGFALSSAVVWSSIALIVTKGSGTAYGIITSFLDTGLVIFPALVGELKDNTTKNNGYYWVTIELITLGSLGMITGILLYFANKNDGDLLHGKSGSVLAEKKSCLIN